MSQESETGQIIRTAERLSSPLTFLYKFVFTAGWPLLFGVGTLSRFVNQQPDARTSRWLFFAAFLLGSAFLWWTCAGLKRVELDRDNLIISNFRRTISVPAGRIAGVHQNVVLSIRPITITFREETPFGRSIVFLPPFSFRLFTEDEIVARLRAMADPSTATRP